VLDAVVPARSGDKGCHHPPQRKWLVPYPEVAWHYSVHDASQPIFSLHPRSFTCQAHEETEPASLLDGRTPG